MNQNVESLMVTVVSSPVSLKKENELAGGNWQSARTRDQKSCSCIRTSQTQALNLANSLPTLSLIPESWDDPFLVRRIRGCP